MIVLEVVTRDRGQQGTKGTKMEKKGPSLVTSMSEELARSALTTSRPDSPLEGRRSKIGDMVIEIAALPTVVTTSSPPDSFVGEPVAESTDPTAGQKKLVSRHGHKHTHSAHLGATPSQRETRASQRRKRQKSPTALV